MQRLSKDYFENLLDISYDGALYCGAVLDSRLVKPGSIFFAVKGENTDGNLFAQQALDNGAAIAVMDSPEAYACVKGNKALVTSSLSALQYAGRRRLAESSTVRIAVSGSFGKTGTKEMLRQMLSGKYKTYASEQNHNNELGVLLTAAGMPEDVDVAVFELGSNAPGEIEALSRLVRPQIAVLTGLGNAHVGHFGSVEEIAREKLSITAGLENGGVLVANEVFAPAFRKLGLANALSFGRGRGADIRILDCTISGRVLHFTVSTTEGEYTCQLNYPYLHIAENFLAVFAVGRLMEVPVPAITRVPRNFAVPAGRGNIIERGKLTIIDDSYNASLEAVLRAIDSLSFFAGAKYALIGGIGETGEHASEIYAKVAAEAARRPEISFILCGEFYKGMEKANIHVTQTDEETRAALKNITEGSVLVKASHSFGFERYVRLLAGVEEVR
jgi:UDP-N-acetylmuramoyl-tripeptide--D-alanyl-D-alanine ligase